MTNPRDILNEIKWKDELCLRKAEIWYVHRGAKNDTKIITGEDIIDIGKSFMKTNSAMIPYHRVFKIYYKKRLIFEREKQSK